MSRLVVVRNKDAFEGGWQHSDASRMDFGMEHERQVSLDERLAAISVPRQTVSFLE